MSRLHPRLGKIYRFRIRKIRELHEYYALTAR
jgi:hypothetical protein